MIKSVPNLIIGLVGEKGSGKGTFAKILQEIAPKNSISYIRFSDILVETLNLWSLPLIRPNYQELANTMEKTFGSGTFANAIYSRVKHLSGKIIILDGIRRYPEAEIVRKFPKNFIIYITADTQTRFRNLKGKGEKEDEKGMSFAKFMKEERNEAETLIPKIGGIADFKIVNNGTLEEYKIQVKEFNQKYIDPETSSG